VTLYVPRPHRRTMTLDQAANLFGQRAAQRLTLFMLTYHLTQRDGFTAEQAARLLFVRWLAILHGMSDVPLTLAQRVSPPNGMS